MKALVCVLGTVIAASLLAASGAAQKPATIDDLRQELETGRVGYEQARTKAKQAASKGFEGLIRAVRQGRLPAEVQARRLQELEQAHQDLLDHDRWLDDEQVLALRLQYVIAVQKARKPVQRTYENLLKALLQANEKSQVDALLKEKAEFDRELAGQELFRMGSRWRGSSLNAANGMTVKAILNVSRREGTRFQGTLILNPQVAGHPELEVQGTIEGALVTIGVVRVVQGKGNQATRQMQGFLVGDTLILQFAQLGPRGQSIQGWIRLAATK